MHDEAHDGLEVVAVEGDLGLLGHVHAPRVPRALAVAQALQALAAVGRLEELQATPTAEAGEGTKEEIGSDTLHGLYKRKCTWSHISYSGKYLPGKLSSLAVLQKISHSRQLHVRVHTCTCSCSCTS